MISKGQGSAVGNSSTKSLTASAITVSAGDIIVMGCAKGANAGDVNSFVQSGGTATIGQITTLATAQIFNQFGISAWATVLTPGSLIMTVSWLAGSNREAVFVVQDYGGASGVANVATGTLSSATPITVAVSTSQAGSWVVLVAGCIGSGSSGLISAGVNQVLEQVATDGVNVSGYVGSTEASVAPGSTIVGAAVTGGATLTGIGFELQAVSIGSVGGGAIQSASLFDASGYDANGEPTPLPAEMEHQFYARAIRNPILVRRFRNPVALGHEIRLRFARGRHGRQRKA